MGIAAGLCLIVTALLNYFSAIAYNNKGGINVKSESLGGVIIKGDVEFISYRHSNRVNQFFSLYLYMTIPFLFIGAVFLFNDMSSIVVLIAAIAAIIAEITGGIMSKFRASNLPGIIGGGLSLAVTVPIYIY